MLRKDLDRIFTEEVTGYLNNGYAIHTLSMGGSQGDIASVDLTNGQKLYRVFMDSSVETLKDSNNNKTCGVNTIHIYVGISEKVKPYEDRTLWNSDLRIISDEKWYVHENYVTQDINEIIAIRKKYLERNMNKSFYHHPVIDIKLTPKKYNFILNKVRSIKGNKTIKKVNKVRKYYYCGHYNYSCDCVTSSGLTKNINLRICEI